MAASFLTARPVSFYLPASGGKYHAAALVTHEALCGRPVVLDLSAERIMVDAGVSTDAVHPIVCRSCLRLAAAPGYSAAGVAR